MCTYITETVNAKVCLLLLYQVCAKCVIKCETNKWSILYLWGRVGWHSCGGGGYFFWSGTFFFFFFLNFFLIDVIFFIDQPGSSADLFVSTILFIFIMRAFDYWRCEWLNSRLIQRCNCSGKETIDVYIIVGKSVPFFLYVSLTRLVYYPPIVSNNPTYVH